MNKTEIKFQHTEVFPSVDWEAEIQTDDELSEDEHAKKLSRHLKVYLQVEVSTKQNIEKSGGVENMSEHAKANSMRMLDYLYAKFVYHHAMFYRKKEFLDLSKSMESYGEEHSLVAMRKMLNPTQKSNLPLENIVELVNVLGDAIKKREEENEPKDGGYEEAKAMFEKEGLVIQKPVGIGKEGDRDSVCTVHDEIPYHMYLMKSSRMNGIRKQKKVKEEVEEYRDLVDKYHPLIKKVYNALQEQIPGLDDLWVLSGGGAQHQAFFGSNGRYIGILYLGMKNKKASADKDCTLVFEGYEDDERWARVKHFKMDDIEHRAFGKTDPYKEKNERF